jgi:uncharacterized membrane protein
MTQTELPDDPDSAHAANGTDGWFQRAELYVKRNLLWSRLYRTTSYLKSTLWIVPFVAIVLVYMIAPVVRALDAWLDWRLVGFDASGATALYQTVITLTMSLVVFTFGSLLVAIQVASGQMTPRIIATTLLRDNVVRYSVGLFVFTLMFAVYSLNRLDKDGPELSALLTSILGVGCIAAGLFLIDYAARMLRPVSVVARVAREGLAVIESVYPERLDGAGDVVAAPQPPLGEPARIVAHEGSSEIVLAVDLDTLIAEARRARGVIEFLPQVGDFVARDEPLFALYGNARTVDDRRLRAAVALGPERTMEQDPLFAFRILVDIGLKALSPAINDPTTAVLALDQVHRLLRAVGQRRLHGEEIMDAGGVRRVVYRTPNWDDFVDIAFNEIRTCGASSVQVARRLRAMIENLVLSLPAHRRPALDGERARLDRMIETHYPIPEDRALARVADSQGLGGSTAARMAKRR